MGRQIRFSHDDAMRFAEWSGDRNPLHVDLDAARRSVFGRPVVHGVLTTIGALGTGALGPTGRLERLDVEFRSAIFADVPFAIELLPEETGPGLSVGTADAVAVTLWINREAEAIPPADLTWVGGAQAHPATVRSVREQPAGLQARDLQPGREVVGVYATGPVPSEYVEGGLLHPVQARVLALCSYIIGMELPGLRSLFTRLHVEFAADLQDSTELLYRARTIRFDPQFRLLDVRLDVARPDGTFIASADLRCYVRFTPVEMNASAIASSLSSGSERLRGRVVLVTGGSRGLGAEITSAFALAGCHVYASYRRDRAGADALRSSLRAAGANVEFIEGDAADRRWCEAALADIRDRHGRLDVLVLNACAPPSVLAFGPDSADAYNGYMAANLPLANVPLAAALPSLTASEGTVVGISSSFVSAPPAGFGHYVALKEAVESTIRTATREVSGIRAVLARPPRLQTAWNDTPTGVLGTIAASHAAVHIVNAVAEGMDSPGTTVRVLSEFPTISMAQGPAEGPTEPAAPDGPAAAPDFLLSLAASFTAEPLLDGLRFWFRELGVRGEVEIAPYGQILQTLLSPSGGQPPGPAIRVVMLRLRDWLRELRPADAASPEFLRSYLDATARDLEGAMRTHRAQASTETLLVFCPSAPDHDDPAEALLESTEQDLLSRLAFLPGLTVIRAGDFHAIYDVADDGIADHVREHIAHIPYQPGYLHTLATIAMRHVHRKLVPARKLVAVDCDNTLWSGVVGEVGPEGLVFDEQHGALHAALARLSQSGVLIALCSKNEEADVWRVFDTRPDFSLRRDGIVSAAINWQPKSANLRAMADRLNLGLDSFVFIDDNPVECAEVRAACPQILTIEWPQNPADALQLLQHTWELDPRSTTAEDKRRTELYKEEFQRQEFQAQTLTFADFIASLGLVVDIAPLVVDDLKRASQLTLRTNQFNFTTRRRDEAELQALASAGTSEIRTVRVRDRFGDYGLVGLLVAEAQGGEVFADTFLLSCRVLGRGVEHQMVSELGRIAAARGAATVRLRVDPTSRNTPARNFLESIAQAEGYRQVGSSLELLLPAEVAIATVFEPPAQPPAPIAEDDRGRSATRFDDEMIRSRESQIRRTAFELATPAALTAAIDGQPSTAAPASASGPADTAFVFEAFARALNVTVDHVKAVDSLEGLRCDSFKIVEITVSLLERFPSLPGTLLFEHRTVSAIAARITALSAPDATPAVQARLTPRQTPKDQDHGDIAVIGMHLRCAGARSPEELWDLLSAGKVAVSTVAEDRKYFFGRLDDNRPHFAGLLDEIDRFDAELFGITPREAEVMDPQLRLFLEVAWNALEDAGYLGADLEPDTGVFAGVMYGDYGSRANPTAKAAGNPFKSWEGFSLANRLSQVFDFHGPSMAIDTACSSSATAVHLACRALQAGDCRMAIAGGVNLILDPDRFVQLGRLGILSSSGRCLAFGADADGTVLGEGAGIVVLRPLAEALRHGDRIYGVIKATGASTGSGTVGFTAPNPVSQAEAIRQALGRAGVDPRTISYVETHGTGTSLGDPIEVRGLTLAYGDQGLWHTTVDGRQGCSIGSIKPNIGHLEAGAGVMGLIKLLLQLHRGVLLPSVTSAHPNPQIPFADTPFSIQRTLGEWRRPEMKVGAALTKIPRRGALNSFGVGGANAHVIVEEAPEVSALTTTLQRPAHLLAVSARTNEALQRRLADLSSWLTARPDVALADICFSVNTGQRHLGRRAVIAAKTRDEMIRSLSGLAAGEEPAGSAQGSVPGSAEAPKVAFLFTGQGSQHAGMGRDLYETQPVFRSALDRCFESFDPLLHTGRLKDVMFAEAGTPSASLLNQTGFTQPALFSLGFALSELWRSWGIKPAVVLGHSIGEITAMCVAGGLSLEDAVKVVAARGTLMQALPEGGAMTSIMASEARVVPAIAGMEERVAIAAINAPEQVVISGETAAVDAVAEQLASEGIKTKKLVVSHAFHSPLMRPMLEAYEAVLSSVRFLKPKVDFVSAVLGRAADGELLGPAYWLRNVTDPVRFADGAGALASRDIGAFIEMGPQPVLLGLGRQCINDTKNADRLWLPSIRKEGSSYSAWSALLASVGQLYLTGARIDWRGFDAPYSRRRVSLPPYAFVGKRHWIRHRPAIAPAATLREDPNESQARAAAYEVVWRSSPSPAAATTAETQRWVVFGDADDAGTAVAREIQRRGAVCTFVEAGSDADADPLEVLRSSESSEAPLRGVVYLGRRGAGLDPAAAASAGLEDAFRIMRAVATIPGPSTPALWVVTRNGVEAAADRDPGMNLAHAALWGAGRTFALEHPQRWGGLIDLAAGFEGEVAAQGVVLELLARQPDDQIALRPTGRFVPRLVRKEVPPIAPLPVSGTGTYLVTGGLGALGLHTARWLVGRGARHIVLTSRRGLQSPGAAAAVQNLEALGAVVRVVVADIAQPDDVARVLDGIEAGAPLTGVFHAAGVDDTTKILDMKPGDAARVMAAKTIGAWLLHERTRHLPLQAFVSFSSIASVLGSAGRAAYAAANGFIDALAFERSRTHLSALTINWGPWAGGGMATDAALQQYGRVGNRGLVPAEALQMMEMMLWSGTTQGMVADIEWDAFRVAYEAQRPRPLIAELRNDVDGGGTEPPVESRPPWIERLIALAPGQRLPALTSLLQGEIAQTLGFETAGDVAPEQIFRDMGMDSLMSADFAQRLQKRLGVRSTALVFEFPTVSLLSRHLLEKLELPGANRIGVPEIAAAIPAAMMSVVPSSADQSAREAGDVLTAHQTSGSTIPAGGGSPLVTALSNGRTEGYRPEVEAEVFEFHKAAWPQRRADLVAPRWRWMFVESAGRLNTAPRVWLHRQAGKLVGHNGAIPVRVKIGAEERLTGWLVETMVLAEYRTQAVGARLMVEAHEDLPFALSLGQTEQMRAIQLRLGWQQVAPLETAQLLIRPERVLKGKIPSPAAFAAGLALRAGGALRDAMKSRAQPSVRLISRFDESHDALWESFSREVTCAVRRDASYLNWKYVDQPGQDFLRLEVTARSGTKGIVVLMFRDPDGVYKYRRGFIVDVMAPLRDREFMADVVSEAARAAANRGADALLCLHLNPELTVALQAAGFRRREPTRYLLVRPGALGDESVRRLLTPTGWFVTQGDSDIDRPW